jgi:serine O-acetyltransferase
MSTAKHQVTERRSTPDNGLRAGDNGRPAGARRRLPAIHRLPLLHRLREDIEVVMRKDPAASSWREALLYPHLEALWLHRIAHLLYRHRLRTLARSISLYARFRTGIDIHPGCEVGRRLFIDHGAAVVIGETAVIEDDVMLYHNVTLGSIGWWADAKRSPGSRRHPLVGTGAVIGTGASVLGPVTIGAHARIGAHALVLENVPAGGRVAQSPSHPIARPSHPGGGT